MNNQLSNISTQYRKFSKGQYIEHTQFNEFLDFFDDQDRLSRVMLKGVGVVCGLEPQLIYTNPKNETLSSIQLSQGVAITTDGDLLTLNNKGKVSKDMYVSDLKTIDIKDKQYTYFKAYDDYKVHYPSFYNDKQGQIELWELATNDEFKSGFQPVADLVNLEDKYLLLYLESYEKEIKPCRGVDCDNHGIELVRNLKVLVTTKAGIDQICSKDNIYPHPVLQGLKVVGKLERVILEAEPTTASFLIDAYRDIATNKDYQLMFENIDDISKILKIPAINRDDFFNLRDFVSEQKEGFQYAYDVMKDLMETHEEIMKILPKSFTKCFPDLQSFSKHIMLGKLIPETKLDYTRHQFYNSPILDDKKITRRVRLLVERFNQQILQFIFPLKESQNEIRITPSQELCTLGDKAIPFYYSITEDFLKAWNFDKTINRTSETNLSFDTALLSVDRYIQKPLGYNIDKKSFYNIEGSQGTDYRRAVEIIRDIQKKYRLPFDIMALSLEEIAGNKDLSKAYFADYVERFSGLEHKRGVIPGGTYAVVYESEKNPIIIADFSLPYLSCTPKVKDVKLSLPTNTICVDAAPLLFTVSPLNGVVQANVSNGLNGGVTSANGQYFFNPKLVSPTLYNQSITFNVNGKTTDCAIKVVTQPSIQITVAGIGYPVDGSNVTTVNFTVSGANFMDYDYKWDFLGNGNYITLKPDANGKVTYKYFNLDVKRIPRIEVQISGNGCSQSIILSDWYYPPSSTGSLSIKNIGFPKGKCCEDKAPCKAPTLTSIKKNADNTVLYNWDNNGFDYGQGTTILQYSIDGGTSWVSVGQKNPYDLSGTSTVINLPSRTPIIYRVECHGNGCSYMESNEINDIFINEIPVKTYLYRGLWKSDDTIHHPEINCWVEYIDEYGAQVHFVIGSIENGCQPINAQRIIDTNGVSSCAP